MTRQPVHPIIETHLNDIAALCAEFGVAKLEIFGSISTNAFDESRSDIDFLVTYHDDFDLGPWFQRHFELKERLSELFGRPVDLIMATEHRNPYIRESINATRRVLYAA
jgi:predicted nucleotidyltransferase